MLTAPRMVVIAATIALTTSVALLAGGLGGGPDGPFAPAAQSPTTGEDYSRMVMEAWETADQADIEAIYAPDVRIVIAGDTLARDRERLSRVIAEAKGVGIKYAQVGPVAEYTEADGDLLVSSLVEVTGTYAPDGKPIVGFYLIRDGQVVRHVFMDPVDYEIQS